MGMPQLELRQGLNALFIIYIKHPVTIYRVRHSVTGCKIQVDAAPFGRMNPQATRLITETAFIKLPGAPRCLCKTDACVSLTRSNCIIAVLHFLLVCFDPSNLTAPLLTSGSEAKVFSTPSIGHQIEDQTRDRLRHPGIVGSYTCSFV